MASTDAKESLNINGENGGEAWSISGIPSRLWSLFRRRSSKELPDLNNQAWSRIIANLIVLGADENNEHSELVFHLAQHGYDEEVATFWLTDIPHAAQGNFRQVCGEAETDEGNVIASMYAAALNDRMYLVRYPHAEGDPPPHTLLLQNMPERAWVKWREAAVSMDAEPVEMAAALFMAVADGQVTFNRDPNAPSPEGGMDIKATGEAKAT